MDLEKDITKAALAYLKKNQNGFLEHYTRQILPSSQRRAFFTAGMSGAGKTELAISLKEKDSTLLHIDTDDIRDFFKPIGYDGSNSDLYQKAASRGFGKLFDYAIRQGFSLIMDSNLAYEKIAIQNIERLLKRSYHVEIYYLYDDPVKCYEYAVRREMVTHRKVSEDVLWRTNVGSYRTVIEIKKMYQEKIILNFIDRQNEKVYDNISFDTLIKLVGDEFDI